MTTKIMTLEDAIAFYEKQGLVVFYEGDAAAAHRLLHANGYKVMSPAKAAKIQALKDKNGGKEWSHDFMKDPV